MFGYTSTTTKGIGRAEADDLSITTEYKIQLVLFYSFLESNYYRRVIEKGKGVVRLMLGFQSHS